MRMSIFEGLCTFPFETKHEVAILKLARNREIGFSIEDPNIP